MILGCLCLTACLAAGRTALAQTIESRGPTLDLSAALDNWRHIPRGPELSAADLELDPDARPKSRIAAAAAVTDVERFFYLLEHGYCGYGYFRQVHSFETARTEILEELGTRERWRVRDLAELIRRHLDFITDCHLKLGHVQFAGHQDFRFSAEPVLTERAGTYYIGATTDDQEIVSVNDRNPREFVFRSLDAAGLPVLILGTLSASPPEPLRVVTRRGGVESEQTYDLREAVLKRSDLFRRFEHSGIPVVRIRTFSDHHVDQIEGFLRSAEELRGEPCVVVDLRRNGGGNTRWPREWIHRFTGQDPQMNQVLSELVTRTALVGQANYQTWLAAGPGRSIRDRLKQEHDRLATRITAFNQGGAQPYWQAPYIPQRPSIANETTLVVIIDRAVASSGEGMISFLQDQVENVVLVGENTRGALVFGHVTAHRLPESGLIAFLPVKLNVAMDLQFREERGFDPDYWVPADDALNRAVAAIRAGTIPTVIPLKPGVLEAEFTPESSPRFSRREIRRFLQIFMVVFVGTVIGFVNRKRGATIFLLIALGLTIGGGIGFAENPTAKVLAFFLALCNGGIAGYKQWRPRPCRSD